MLATVRGALSGYSSTLIGPRSVSKTAFRDMGCLVGVGCPADMRAEGRDSIGSRRLRLRPRSKVYYPSPSILIVAPCHHIRSSARPVGNVGDSTCRDQW